MKLLLLCLGLTLVCAYEEGNHDVVTSNINMAKISGEWYSILFASEEKENMEEYDGLKIFLEYLKLLDNSSLSFTFFVKANGECTEHSLICDKTEKDGEYSAVYNGVNKFHIAEAVYNDYIILYNVNINNEKEIHVTELCARKPDVRPELKKHFEKFCRKHGIPKENILDLTKTDRCLQARWSQVAQDSRIFPSMASPSTCDKFCDLIAIMIAMKALSLHLL
ncbi:allergen Fel d 4-like [Pteropus vampyrus]|uniref:Allergen Fel d 4-like n=1 Tax=Pteropus vampyrus TaxID=132908 RepID=A0A6P3RYQ4_PTEVA|nr:allergen Fel d 4-like [Pteropus vampyrus]